MDWLNLIPFIGQAASGIASIFQGDKEGEQATAQPMMPDWQLKMGKQVADWISNALQNYTPGASYGGQLTAPMTSQESKGLSILDQYLGAPQTGELYGAAKNELLKTLGGEYADPRTSPLIKALSTINARNLQDQITRARGERAGRNQFFHSEGLKEERALTERNLQDTNAQIADFMNTERGRMLGAVPQAAALEEYANQTVPLKQMAASQTYGSLARNIEQADLEAQYNAYLNQRKEQQAPVDAALGLYRSQPTYGFNTWNAPAEENTFMRIMNMLGSLTNAGNMTNLFQPTSWPGLPAASAANAARLV